MRSIKWLCISLWLVLVCLSHVSPAQVTYAALHGTVSDASGAVIPSATVTVLNTGTGIQNVQQADKNGYYVFPQLQVGGPYSVTISAPGFQSFVASGLTLNVNDNRQVDGKLKVGAASQTVEVSATALQVETSNTQLQQVATAEQLEAIPLEGRDPAGLQKLAPGVVESSDRFGSYSSNGSQTAQNSYLLNGADINDGPLQSEGIAVNPDALSEENIVTSTMNPEFARNSGAVVNEIIKSGSNGFHGSGFEFYRDTFLNNGNYFSQIRPPFHQNLYGGTLGGPVLRNKLFFFLAYQGLRNSTAQTQVQTTLSPAQTSGQFSNNTNRGMGFVPNNAPFKNDPTNVQIGLPYCPTIPNRVYSDSLSCNPMPFAYNGFPAGTPWIVAFNNGGAGAANVNAPPATWNSVSSYLINHYVPPANSGINQFNFNSLDTHAQDQGVIRADYTLGKSDTIWGSTVFQSSPATYTLPFGGSSFPGSGMVRSEHYKIFSGSWTHTFNANMLNELRAAYYRFNFAAVIPGPGNVPPSAAGFSINPQLSQAGLPYIAIANDFDLGFSYEGPQPRLDTNVTYADNFTLVRGNHSLKFGASFEQFRVRNPFGLYNNGNYGFYGGTNGGGAFSSGDPIMDFALGLPDTYTQTNDGFIDALSQEFYAYAQDNWRVNPDLTLNFGIAWDAEEPTQNAQFGGLGIVCWANSAQVSNIYPGGPPGLTYNGDPGCNRAGGPTTIYGHFGPRIGFAWSPSSGPAALVGASGAHALSIRGGFGIYYNRDQEEQSLQNLGDPPALFESHGAQDFGGSPAFANPFADVSGAGSEANPFPYTPPAAGGAVNWGIYNQLDLAAFSPTYKVPYTYNFNLNIQRALGSKFLAQVGYVGSISHRLATWFEGDPITAAGHNACLADPNCSPSSIHLTDPEYTAQPAIVAGTGGGAIPSLPNGVPWYLSIGDQDTEGFSNYNSFQASLIKSPSHGLQFTLGYTYSHALDDGSGYESITGGDQTYGNYGRVRNYVPGFEYLNYGSSDFDARQRFVASYVYSVPVAGFLKSNLILREALAGWGVGGITAFQTGFPVAVSIGSDSSYWCDGYSYFGCPDVPQTSTFDVTRFSNPRSKPTGNGTLQGFDTSPFSPEPRGTFGNSSRNFFRGPGFNYTNLQILKNFHFSRDERQYLQLRLEAFNAFNHANFAPPNGSFGSPLFGQINSVIQSADSNADPQPGRAIQIAGKFYFLIEPDDQGL